MSDEQKLKETLSALMDGEAGKQDQLELRRLVRSLGDHPDLLQTYERYLRTRAVMQGEVLPPVAASFLDNVRQGIEHEEATDLATSRPAMAAVPAASPPVAPRSSWLSALGRVAIAASVAVVTVLLVQSRMPAASPEAPLAAAAPSVAPVSEQPAPVLAARNTRAIDSPVMAVSAGSNRAPAANSGFSQVAAPAGGCVLGVAGTGLVDPLWEKPLPEGYSVCRQNRSTLQCEVVSEKIGCYLR